MSIKSLTKDCYLTTDQLYCGGGQDYYVATAERLGTGCPKKGDKNSNWLVMNYL